MRVRVAFVFSGATTGAATLLSRGMSDYAEVPFLPLSDQPGMPVFHAPIIDVDIRDDESGFLNTQVRMAVQPEIKYGNKSPFVEFKHLTVNEQHEVRWHYAEKGRVEKLKARIVKQVSESFRKNRVQSVGAKAAALAVLDPARIPEWLRSGMKLIHRDALMPEIVIGRITEPHFALTEIMERTKLSK